MALVVFGTTATENDSDHTILIEGKGVDQRGGSAST
jgi:hypothetical protein